MRRILHLILAIALSASLLPAQDARIHPGPPAQPSQAKVTPILQAIFLGDVTAPSADLKWKPALKPKKIAFEPMTPEKERIEAMKAEKLVAKRASTANKVGEAATTTANPIIGTNFLGNGNDGSSPLDNFLAISDGGIVISVANGTLEIDDENGSNLYYNDIATFINDPGISNVCDPLVLYDRRVDRFIFFVQECSGNSSNSKIILAFSKTNNPAAGGWWKYTFTGNPLSDNSWFDYPKMAVSNNQLYVTGNLFSNSGNFNQSVIYTIDKVAAYNGGTTNYQVWNNIDGSPGTILAVGEGHGQTYGPGCLFVSSSASGSSDIKLYDLTADMGNSPALNYYSVSTTAYSPAADSDQMGTSCQLDNGDCRALSGFYLNGTIHFVFHSDIGSGWNGINYNRLNVSAQTNVSQMFGSQGNFDYSYPSVSPFSTSASDKSVMIGFGRVSSAIYPQVRVVHVDPALNFSASVLVKASASFVSYTSSTKERWGDYTGTARRHNAATPTIWMNGMFGTTDNVWNTWIAEITADGSVDVAPETESSNAMSMFPNPASDRFVLNFSLEKAAPLTINLVDASGKLVQALHKGQGHKGENLFSFNTGSLSSGTYFLQISDNFQTLQNEKIVLAR